MKAVKITNKDKGRKLKQGENKEKKEPPANADVSSLRVTP